MGKTDFITILSMLLLLFVYVFAITWHMRLKKDRENFFDQTDTVALRGIFCIIVVLVHTPVQYVNPIQDLIGSFAYIGVTFFFMLSAYGLKYGVDHKPGYLKHFWGKHLVRLLIPMLLLNLLEIVFYLIFRGELRPLKLFNLNPWVQVLLLDYILIWIVYSFYDRKGKTGTLQADIVVCACVLGLSLITMFTPWKPVKRWPVESLGVVFGILLARYYDTVKAYTKEHWLRRTCVVLLLSLLLGVSYLKLKYVPFWGDYALKTLLGMSILVFVLFLIRKFRFENRMLNFLGLISYEVYLIHDLVFRILEEIPVPDNSGIFLTAAFSLIIAGAAVMYRLSDGILRKLKPGSR